MFPKFTVGGRIMLIPDAAEIMLYDRKEKLRNNSCEIKDMIPDGIGKENEISFLSSHEVIVLIHNFYITILTEFPTLSIN